MSPKAGGWPPGHRGRRTVAAFLVVALGLISVSGCWGKKEVEDRSFVTLMGVDRGDGENLLVTTVIAIPRARQGGGPMGGQRDGGGSSVLLSGQGRGIIQALSDIEIIGSRELSTLHLGFLVLGEDMAREDVGPVIDLFSRSLEFRHNTLVAVCEGRAIDFLGGLSAIEETAPSEHLRKLIVTTSSEMGVCPVVTMHEFMVGYNTLAIDPWAPYVSLASPLAADDAGDGTASEAGSAAQSPTPPPTTVAIRGTAVFRKVGDAQRMVGYLDTQESIAALLMSGALHSAYLSIAYPGDLSETSLLIHRRTSSVKVDVRGPIPRATFTMRTSGSIEESQVGIEQPETTREFLRALVETAEGQLRTLLDRTFRKVVSLGADAIGVGSEAQKRFGTEAEWEEYNWPGRFPDCEAVFQVKVDIPTTGFTFQKPYPR